MRATNDGLFPRSPIQTSNARGAPPVSNERDDTARRDDDDETRRSERRGGGGTLPEDAIDVMRSMRCDAIDAMR